jgi:CheY-like chemotaxis protein
MKKKLQVLLIDDDNKDYLLIDTYLTEIKDQYSVMWASGFEESKAILATTEIDVILLDYILGEITGKEVLSYLKNSGITVPVLLLTSDNDEFVDKQAIVMGAADYLTKSKLDSQIVDRTIRYALERAASLNILSEREERYRKIYENSGDSFLFTNSLGAIIEGNPAAEIFLLKNNSSLKGKSIGELISSQAEEILVESFGLKKGIQNLKISFKNLRNCHRPLK